VARAERKRQLRKLSNGRGQQRASPAEFVDAGVSGFVQKGTSERDFLDTIRSVARGSDSLLLPSIVVDANRKGSKPSKQTTEKAFGLVRLTIRERDVFALIAAGLSRQQIARKLHLAIGTIDRHVQRIGRELSTHSRLEFAGRKKPLIPKG